MSAWCVGPDACSCMAAGRVGGLIVVIGEALAEQGEGLACRLDGTGIALAGCSAGDEAAAVVLGQGSADREDLACGQAGGAVSG